MTTIYHITHLGNLPNIIQDGGLWCDRVVMERNLAYVSIAHQHIKERRAQKQVPCAAGGTLADLLGHPVKMWVLKQYGLVDEDLAPFGKRIMKIVQSKFNRQLYKNKVEGYGYLLFPQK